MSGSTVYDVCTDAPGLFSGVANLPVSEIATGRSCRNENETPVTPAAIQSPTYSPPDEGGVNDDCARITTGGKPPDAAVRL